MIKLLKYKFSSYHWLTEGNKNKYILVVIFSLFLALLEIVGIASLTPLIAQSDLFSLESSKSNKFYDLKIFDINKLTMIIIILSIFFLRIIFSILMDIYITRSAYSLLTQIRNKILSNYLIFVDPSNSLSIGTLKLYLDFAINVSNNFLIPSLKIIGSLIFTTGVLISLIYFFSLKLLLIFCIGGLSIFFIVYFSKSNLIKFSKNVASASKNYYDLVADIRDGREEIIVSNKVKYTLDKSVAINSKFAIASIKKIIIVGLPKHIIEFTLIVILCCFLILFEYGYLDLDGTEFIFLGLITIRLLPVATNISSLFNNMNFAKVALKELNLYFNTKNHFSAKNIEIESRDENTLKSINLENVHYKYNIHNVYGVLEKINFNLKLKDSLLVKGESGSGKSTLLKIVSGFIKPSKGKCYFEISSKNETKIVDSYKARGFVSIITQNPLLFEGSVRDNIIFGNHKKDLTLDKKVIDCLKKVNFNIPGIDINDLLDFQISSRGNNISGGQAQRLAIARAIFQNNTILLFDECTNSLDNYNKKLIMNLIKQISASENKIIVFITHDSVDENQFKYILDLSHK